MITIRQIKTNQEADQSVLIQLVRLLQNAVHQGASVGFLSPLSDAQAMAYWTGVFESLQSDLVLWVAEVDGQVVGSVQLALCMKANGRHRADVQKLFVHSDYRGHGISSRLLTELEAFAIEQKRSLLVLDTEAGSLAEKIYQHWAWVRVGEIPHYAGRPDGQLTATCYYYKTLAVPVA